ncbi:MAG TPA: MltA domain-containing protein [Roseiarcus sp.]|nr:MltA domain-containing protein [Roseiarcus sp.]
MSPRLEPLDFESLAGWSDDDHLAALNAFKRSARALAEGRVSPRPAQGAPPGLVGNARAALCGASAAEQDARRFFETRFRPFRVVPANGSGFLTGYYEPCIPASTVETEEFRWPILGRPADLVCFGVGVAPAGFPEGVSGARRLGDGSLVPYADRAAIEAGRREPIVWVRDAVEAFLIQVQGSAQLEFPDRRRARLAYDGRNGLPYTSIGRILIEAGEIAESDMSLKSLKAWLRRDSDRGLALMRRNRSFVFFKLVDHFDPTLGPIAGAGVPLTPLRSIAVDRTIWAYGLPLWIDAALPWVDETPRLFRRLMVAQDTGSAIVGPARADLYFGSGEEAGARAGAIRHRADFTVLLPREQEP